MRHRRQGFTLIELAITLVIMGLLVGGVAAARALIHSAEMQSALGDIAAYKKAAKLFHEKYKSYPGDFPTATAIWGSPSGLGSCNDLDSASTPGVGTCNGNGDGFVGDGASNLPHEFTGSNYREALFFWQQLGNAELVSGKYTGTKSSNNDWKVTYNLPISKLGGNGYTFFYVRPFDAAGAEDGNLFAGEYRHSIVFGKTIANTLTQPSWGAGLSGEDAMAVDRKIDDGRPASGTVRAFGWNFMTCVTSNIASMAFYDLTYGNDLTCALIFMTGY